MKRTLDSQLLAWKTSKTRIPLLLRGARQVGKSFAVEKLGQTAFESFITVNFEKKPDLAACFTDLDPKSILSKLELALDTRILPGQSLLFLDEIQNCPQAILALRYFKEEMPALHVIAAGSLLEFVLNEGSFSFPVGRVQPFYVRPMSFLEFLKALGKDILVEAIEQSSIHKPFEPIAHKRLLELVRQYLLIGGMPEAIQAFVDTHSIAETQQIHARLIETYQTDFSKYASKTTNRYLQRFFERTPKLVGEAFKYVNVDPDAKSRDLKETLQQLSWAGLVSQVYATSASGIPLHSQAKFEKFKLLFVDIGLMQRFLRLNTQAFWEENIAQINSGAIAEQLVGQELLTYQGFYQHPQIHYWHREARTSTAEVDYVIQTGSQIVPIEVKAGKTGRRKSIQIFLKEKKLPLGVKISQNELGIHKNILSVPFYLISVLPNLIRELTEYNG
ncbi:MAG: ATP-binding protein [Deltaproteobacteria bacterium]|nr:ATP-binding protein [Deltaproteobacteria bacterium]